ncbi:hypothetical protein F3Y22_tig00000916pilonHSYRG00062 [Hibiscus syriacus]|uniref:Terpene synthase metal-binding domain-containing protein n=1 Tax=Hibiscus syriacus TaxID=106335 RepID=A0A6A3D3K7_HIBSY|nr:hypothetical protein F3Y22_tig00000916pilonHSYRG00062 [Hibiscus syriacus]
MSSVRAKSFKSDLKQSSHFRLGRPLLLVPSTVIDSTLLTASDDCRLWTCPNHRSLPSLNFSDTGTTPKDILIAEFATLVLLDVHDEVEKMVRKEGRSFTFFHTREEFKKTAEAHYEQTWWVHEGCQPTFHEFLESAMIAAGGNVIMAQEATEALKEMIEAASKDLNQGCLRPTPIPRQIFNRSLNYRRLCETFYMNDDGYGKPETCIKDVITKMLIHPIPLLTTLIS